MLLRFSVSNFLSFRDEVTLSMVASSDERHPQHIFRDGKRKANRFLRGAAIYGANGHGKTNLVHSIAFARDFVLEGPKGASTGRRPFKGGSKANGSSDFVFEFSLDGIRFEYGFKVDGKRVVEEWLFYAPRGHEVKVFERVTEEGGEDKKARTFVDLGTELKKKIRDDDASGEEYMQFIAAGIPANKLYFTECFERNVSWFEWPMSWLRDRLQIVTADSIFSALTLRAHEDTEFMDAFSDRIKKTGIGIDRVETSTRSLKLSDLSEMQPDVLQEINEQLEVQGSIEMGSPGGGRVQLRKREDGDLEILELMAVYKREGGEEVKFSQSEESSGTRRLFDLMPMLLNLSEKKVTYIVDEFDRKLHPLLSHELVRIFFEDARCGQLIFTTHDTNLLDLDLLRRDEIWFVEKAPFGSTDLYSLSDLKVRPDIEIGRGYLKGRFGAIPFFGEIKRLGWSENEIN